MEEKVLDIIAVSKAEEGGVVVNIVAISRAEKEEGEEEGENPEVEYKTPTFSVEEEKE